MEIKDFITASLEQIAEGTRNAQAAVTAAGGYVNPAMHHGAGADPTYFGSYDSHQSIFLVDFDIAVTVAEELKGEGGAKLRVAGVFSLGGSGAIASSSETTSRLRFKVPLALPVDQESKVQTDRKRRAEDARVRAHNDALPG
jgi:hypothetical protein